MWPCEYRVGRFRDRYCTSIVLYCIVVRSVSHTALVAPDRSLPALSATPPGSSTEPSPRYCSTSIFTYESRPCAPRFPGDDPSAPKPEGYSHILRCGSRPRRGALCNPVSPKPLSLPVPEHLQYRRQRTAPTVRHLVHSYPACTCVHTVV